MSTVTAYDMTAVLDDLGLEYEERSTGLLDQLPPAGSRRCEPVVQSRSRNRGVNNRASNGRYTLADVRNDARFLTI
jgi:hypothetical protein